MAMDFVSDLDAIFDTDEHAQTATYTRQGDAPAQIPVIFENGYAAAEYDRLSQNVAVESTAPRATCRDADIPGVSHGATLAVSGTTYYVVEVRPDGTGVTVLLLSMDPV